MLSDEHIQTVLISPTREPTGHERLVMAFRDGDDLYIPLDGTRPANNDLLSASQIYVRDAAHPDRYAIYAVDDHQPITASDRARLERSARSPISVTTEVLHVRGVHSGMGQLDREPPSFVVLLDGSEDALRALAPARALGSWYGRACTVVEVTAGSDDAETDTAVALQLETVGFTAEDVVVVAKRDLHVALFEWMRHGHMVVACQRGARAFDGRLHGVFNALVSDNAPAIIGIGPNVASDWAPSPQGPIIVCVDGSEHAHHVVDKLVPFLCPSRGPVIVAHFETATAGDTTIANTVAAAINKRFGIPTRAVSQPDESVAAGIAVMASREHAQLVITHSWHRPTAQAPNVNSTSLGAVTHAMCPVVVLSD